MAGPNLAEIPNLLKAVGIASQKDVETAQQIRDQFAAAGRNTAAQAAAAREGTFGRTGEALAVLEFQDNQQLIADTIKSNAAAAAGFSPDGTAGIQNILMQDITRTGLQMRETAKRLAEEKSVSLFDDPLQALSNAFTIPWTEQELAGLKAQQDVSFKTLQEVNSGLTNTAATAEALKGKIGAAGIAANAKARAADLERNALAIEAAGFKDNIQALDFVYKATQRELDHIKVADAFYNNKLVQARADAHLALARKADERAALESEERIKAGKAKEADLQIVRDADAMNLAYANKARAADGLPPYTSVGEWKTKYNTTAEGRKFLDREIDRGRRLMTPGFAATDSFGATVAETLENIRHARIEPRTPQERAYASVLLEAEKVSAASKKGGKEFDSDAFIKSKIKGWENYKKGDASNPNAPVSYEILAGDPVISKNPLFATIIAPTITDANKKLAAEPSDVFARISSAMIANPEKINPDQAARLMTFIYDKSTALNNANNQPYKWLRDKPTKLTAELEVGTDPRIKLGADVVTATGAAMIASGIGTGPGVAVSALGIASEAYALTGGVRRVDLSDVNAVKSAFVRKVVSELGFTINSKTNEGPYSRDASGRLINNMPLFERNRVIESKGSE